MGKIKFSNSFLYKLEELVKALYKNGYFGFLESSENYVSNIIDFIYTIPSLKKKATGSKRYGAFYCKYKHNNKTTWYITFDLEEDTLIIQDITNNHSSEYPLLFP
jgi:hypothetical protein